MTSPPYKLQAAGDSPDIWIKICGLTTAADVDAAAAAGVDAMGFVFYPPSKRCLAPRKAAELAARVPRGILKVAVMLHPTQGEVDAVLAAFHPDVLQTDYEDFSRLAIPEGIARLPVYRGGSALPARLPPRLLFEGPVSGAGATTDWSEAVAAAGRCQLILAGGLNAGNVAQAIARVQPFGVDVSSGVESAPGIKDPQRIREFVQAARAVRIAGGSMS